MMTEENEKIRKQMQIVCIDDLVPQNHLLSSIGSVPFGILSLRLPMDNSIEAGSCPNKC